MKTQKRRLTLHKLTISKLTNLSIVNGGSNVDDEDDGTLRIYIPTRCKTETNNGNDILD